MYKLYCYNDDTGYDILRFENMESVKEYIRNDKKSTMHLVEEIEGNKSKGFLKQEEYVEHRDIESYMLEKALEKMVEINEQLLKDSRATTHDKVEGTNIAGVDSYVSEARKVAILGILYRLLEE